MQTITAQCANKPLEHHPNKHHKNSTINSKAFNCATGHFIRQKRVALGLTGIEFGRLLNVSQQQISRYECGITSITLCQLNSVLYYLNVSWATFINEVTQSIYFKSSFESI